MTGHIDLPQGTPDLLILKTVALGPQHGRAISERIQQISNRVLQVQLDSLCPALQRLERRGWIRSRWGTSKNNRQSSTNSRGRDKRGSRTTRSKGATC